MKAGSKEKICLRIPKQIRENSWRKVYAVVGQFCNCLLGRLLNVLMNFGVCLGYQPCYWVRWHLLGNSFVNLFVLKQNVARWHSYLALNVKPKFPPMLWPALDVPFLSQGSMVWAIHLLKNSIPAQIVASSFQNMLAHVLIVVSQNLTSKPHRPQMETL